MPAEKIVSSLAGLEVRSAIRRREHLGDMSSAHAISAISSLFEELKLITILTLSEAVLLLAAQVIDRQRLTSLDAMQLATAIIVGRKLTLSNQLQFVASDKRLLAAAEAEGLDTWNPTGSG